MTDSSSPLRVGVVGLGAIGQRLLGVFGAHPEVVVTAVSDLNRALSGETASRVRAASVEDPLDLVSRDDVDLVYVAVPPAAHRELVLAAARHGKHVLCEKPLATSAADGREMLEAVRAAGVVHA
ncbi:Gfo/Idh/MocA family protein, partial [Deinococcus pimensis]|uniref:Gfo/Idh/MocA family protein n=1 Tax=Deinococcus pimensis TaxID=309888 RepID=UPI0005EB7861